MANADAYVLVLRPRGQRPVYYVDRDAYNQYMVRASPNIGDAHLYRNEGIAEGMRDDLMHAGYPGYEVLRVIDAVGRPIPILTGRGGSG